MKIIKGYRTNESRDMERKLRTLAKIAHDDAKLVWQKMILLAKAITRLRVTPLSSFEAIQWFREAQRLLLEVQAWILYTDVIAPRRDDPTYYSKGKVLPVRGVITGRAALAHEMFRIRVPVWLVRPTSSFTKHTIICKSVPLLDWPELFSVKQTMVHGKFSMETPRWIDGAAVDTIGEGMALRMRRYGLSGRPHLCRSQPVWHFEEYDHVETVSQAARVESDGTSITRALFTSLNSCVSVRSV